MPPPFPLGDTDQVYELRACWLSTPTHTASSAWSFRCLRDSDVTPASIVDAWRASLEEAYVTRRPDGFVLLRLVVVDVWPGVQADYVFTYPDGGYAPDSTGEPTAPQLSPVISWRSGLAGRSYRGRTFWGFVRESDVAAGYVLVNTEGGTQPPRTFGFNMIRDFCETVGTAIPQFVIVSRHHDGVALDPPVYTPVSTYQVDTVLRTIRKRNDNPPEYHE